MSSQSTGASKQFAELITWIERREFTIGIVGMRYVGLPLAITTVQEGFNVVGFDINAARVDLLSAGQSAIEHIDDAMLDKALAKTVSGNQ